jgi:allophanate hydrolase subunit 2
MADRMGLRYRGPKLTFKPRNRALDHIVGSDPSNILTTCIPTGGIQVVAGVPIVIAVDGGTTGGYAKIGTVLSCDLAWIGQSKPGDHTLFKEVSVDEGRRVLKEEEAVIQEGSVTN